MARKYNEIFKLKEMLEVARIPFEWQENWGHNKETLKEMERIAPEMVERYQLCYPKFNESVRVCSAIQGYGTYGSEIDLIEIMGLLEEGEGDGCVVGYLTAEEVFNRIKKHYYNERKVVIMKKKVKVVDEETLELKEIEVEDETSTEYIDDFANELRQALGCESEEFYQKYKDYKKAEQEFNDIYIPFKTKLIDMYKSNPDIPKNIIIGGTKLTYVSPSTRDTIDSKKLKEEEPELAKKYTKTSNVSASIRLSEEI